MKTTTEKQNKKQYTEQEQQDIYLLKNIPIKNIQVSYLGCQIVVFEKTPQEIINFLKNKGFEHFKDGVYHTLKKENMYFSITNRRNIYFNRQINPEIIKDLNLSHLYLKNE